MMVSTTGSGLNGPQLRRCVMGGEMTKPNSVSPGGVQASIFDHRIGRRDLLKGAGALGVAGLTMPWLSAARALAGAASASSGIPIKHVVVDMQENRSFD